MIKDELRKKMREKRRALTKDEWREKSERIRKLVFSLGCMENAETVCSFISAFKEPDTTEIIKLLLQRGKKVTVPVTDMVNTTLSLSYIDSMSDMQRGALGIPEPIHIKHAEVKDIDVLLIPGLAFDHSGGRMGFGKGYYDRLLENTGAKKIALCYEFQLFDTIPTEPHDIPMDFIVTEERIYVV